MAENKTRATDASVEAFLAAVTPAAKQADARALDALMQDITGEQARMWGPTIVGYGSYHYRYDSGREGDSCLTGFSPRKAAISVYIMPGFDSYDALLARLGKHKTGASCLYVNKLADIDMDILAELVRQSVAWMREKYPAGKSA
ncbi:MAG: DUF1801 domain-containing protein [Alphaproteobacteria bacterium]|nr:MAG: DUF1801 domain-containing protein [Alphaproteobacteria bacterium]